MRRFFKVTLWTLAALLALPILLVAVLLGALNTDLGRTVGLRQLVSLTGDSIRLQGLSGRFPDHLRLAHLELRDSQGTWLQADDIALDWSPLDLFHRQALIHRLEVSNLLLPRLPASDPAAAATPAQSSKPFTLPVRVTVESLSIPKAHLGAPLAGAPATLSLTATADLPNLETGTTTIRATRTDSPGTYSLDATVTPDSITTKLEVTEPDTGLVAQLAKLPAIGPLHFQAATTGPRNALATTLSLTAGPLTATATGAIDLVQNAATIELAAQAPAMRPAPGIAWRAITLATHITGPFTTPDATGQLHVEALEANGVSLDQLDANLSGNTGQVSLQATAITLRIPGPNPALLTADPLRLEATARLDDPARPVRFTLSHHLLTLAGTALTATDPIIDATLTLPDLTPFAALANTPAAGHTILALHATRSNGATTATIEGALDLTAGPAPTPALLGPGARINLAATMAGPEITLTHGTIDGAAIHLNASGSSKPAGLDLTTTLSLPNLALVAPTIEGDAKLQAHLTGPITDLTLAATLTGDIGAPSIPRAPIQLAATLTGLPAAPTGHITAQGTLARAPVHLALDATRDPDGTLRTTIQQADWRTLHAEGALTLPPGATLPKGRIALRFENLADLHTFLPQPLTGAVTATLVMDPTAATLEAEARNTGIPGSHVTHATLKARVTDPAAHPAIAATLTLDGIAAGTTTGSLRLDATGPQEALALKTAATLNLSGAPAQITATARLDTPAKQLRLDTLQIQAHPPALPTPETVKLLAPATIRFAEGLSLDHLRLGLRQATLDVAGRLSPTLDATISLRTPADIAAIVAPALAMDGAVTLDAKLGGTPAQPTGAIKLAATALRLRTGPGRAIPPATITATAQLAGTSGHTGFIIDARLAAGTATLSLTGQAPLAQGPLNLRATGALDLTLLDPILTAVGRRARGRLTLDTSIAGTLSAPRIIGAAQLTGGELQDFTQGVRITDIAASIRADADTIRIASLTGRAGPGTIAASGTIGAFAPGLPIDLAITLRNARPLASDTITADLDADLTIKGPAVSPAAAGHILIRHAELQIPTNLPASVPTLNVRRPGDKPPAPPAPAAPIALDLTIDAPNQVFLRGRGVDAEMSGTIRIKGTAAAPQVGGGLSMRRGAISIAGTTLTFSRGKIGFDGTGISGKIDPTLDFAADSTAASTTATLAITGYVSKPKITLSSVPDLPQDEVLAYLIFKRSAKDLGPFQIAQIAAGLAQLSGVGGSGGFSPLESIRKGLGLDRLFVGSSPAAGTTTSASSSNTVSTPTVEGGRYVAPGVYVGARQSTSGAQTQATVQIDITKGLKVETDVGSGQGGNQLGLTYQFEY